MTRVDTPGVFRAEVVEAAVSTTKKSGYPQYVARYRITEKYVEDPDSLKHFGLTEPAWVDWSEFNEDVVGYSILFKANVNEGEVLEPGENDLPSYDSIQRAFEWDGTSFGSLLETVGKKVLIRIDEDEYEGKTSLRVNWVDHVDSPPHPELRGADKEGIAALDKLLKVSRKPKPAPAKPGPASKPKPGGKPAPAAPPKSKPKQEEAPEDDSDVTIDLDSDEVETEASAGLPQACSQIEAWEFVCENKGDNDDGTVQEAWLSAIEAVVGSDGDEDDLDDAGWAKVLATVVKDLNLTVS